VSRARGTALVLGGGQCVWDDIDALEALMGEPWPGVVLVCNDMGYKEGHSGRRWDRPIHHWCTLHAEKLQGWQNQRRNAGLPKIEETWSSVRRTVVKNHFQGITGGSSGLYTVSVALFALGYPRVVTCGIPMDATKNTFSARDWTSFKRYKLGWERDINRLKGRVRSMSGWTAQVLGRPTVDWIGIVPPFAKY